VNKALFLDRDGVINVEKHYLYKIEEFEFTEGIFDLCRYYRDRGYLIVVVTNQSGIARGYYSEDDFARLSEWMVDQFKEQGVDIAGIYYCPHHPEISGACSCRKPEPGMLLDAAENLDIDLKNSVMVGDKERDIEAAVNAGVGRSYLFTHGRTVASTKATSLIDSLKDAAC
jgi:D-glycero-D-manno-heptose 1,7-bisphosphate phosphatase